jgi:hypothetical protein
MFERGHVRPRWSKHEREEWERLQREGEAGRLRTISAIEPTRICRLDRLGTEQLEA